MGASQACIRKANRLEPGKRPRIAKVSLFRGRALTQITPDAERPHCVGAFGENQLQLSAGSRPTRSNPGLDPLRSLATGGFKAIDDRREPSAGEDCRRLGHCTACLA